MKPKRRKTYRIILCVLAWALTALSSSIAYGFLGGTGWSFGVRFAVGFVLMCAPLSVFWVVVELLKKEKE